MLNQLFCTVLKIKIFIIAGLSFLMLSQGMQAQESPSISNRSTTIQRVDGRQYYFHAVLQGQTLFSIARAYGVSVDDIINENPELRTQELRFDQIIRIPVKQSGEPLPSRGQVQTITVTDVSFIEHQVKRRETVYGIARTYGIQETQLIEHNPQIRSGLRVNMMLRVPILKESTIHFIEYTVPPRQTLFSIAREFKVSITELEKLNPELREGLRAGQVLKIPVEYAPDTHPPFVPDKRDQRLEAVSQLPETTDPYCANPQRKRTYNVALLIPLYLENFDTEGGISPQSQERSLRYMEYYEGIVMALDSVRAMGADIRLSVYDVCESELKARTAIWKPEMAQMDLIIGPFFTNTFQIAATFARDRNIPIVSPVSADDREPLRRYPNMFQATPDLQTQMHDMAAYIAQVYPEDNIILVHNNQENIRPLIFSLKQYLNYGINRYRYLRDSASMAKIDGYFIERGYVGERISNVYVINDSIRDLRNENGRLTGADFQKYANDENIREVIYSRDGIGKIRADMDRSRRNVVVTLMGGEAMIANYTRQLNQLRDTFNIVLFGVPQWRDYRSVDAQYLQNLNTHIFSVEFIDYEKPANINFIRRYRSINHVEPGSMALRAVETGVFFFSALHQYGQQFYRCMDVVNKNKAPNSPIVFKRAFPDGGWENTFVFIYRYENFSLRDVREPGRQSVIFQRRN